MGFYGIPDADEAISLKSRSRGVNIALPHACELLTIFLDKYISLIIIVDFALVSYNIANFGYI